ncbi:Ypt/Rab-GAP domain of gyp1p superfamily protein, putative isoform 1 [Quillaja saponaria]|uniref:Ypt/Rab-GAP domain of gyp1p superfamily protein, putative isoform 1 n=1 Tax=Quillaja saponaria TaxID=32244 RepID=A0AAD7QFV0_QUISA|nr:Ypt/Rab-GAP domain of gyp1p superfamily protein, putative isoform 1 [Quillaja saponaria]
MSCGEEGKQWSCGKAGTVNLQKVTSIVRDIGDPCLSQSPIKVVIVVNKMLKPDKWQATLDSEGKVFGFHKALKLIVLGGVDPSIRPAVWEILLGCYALDSTAEYRRQLRTARRERYRDLIQQCQMMHSSIGTGSLAYVVGSKVMDMRTPSKDDRTIEAKVERRSASSNNTNKIVECSGRDANCTDTTNECLRECSSDLADISSLRETTDSAVYDSSGFTPIYDPYNCTSPKVGREADGSHYLTGNCFDFPTLHVTDLFERSGEDKEASMENGDKLLMQHKYRYDDDRMDHFQISNNVHIAMESNGQEANNTSHPLESEIEIASPDVDEPDFQSSNLGNRSQMISKLRISDVPEMEILSTSPSQGRVVNEERVSEWLWTLHRIVVDVVRTDSHLEFYEDTRNLARMSDILAVCAWVDPATGYCQGMSDLLSPFVVLFEDNADAFWCFEMLLRRMRENFQMEGPTGVMKQLQALWHILELTDREMFAHLSHIGAESLHFAFRMLLVLFRRELSFGEALSMWEMMWAADFDESLAQKLEDSCPEPLVIQLPKDSDSEILEESADTDDGNVKSGLGSNHNENGSKKGGLQLNHGNIDHCMSDNLKLKSLSSHPFCGLTRNFWSKNDPVQICTVITSARNGDDELPVFCVAAILIINRHKIIKETRSFDDMIKAGAL